MVKKMDKIVDEDLRHLNRVEITTKDGSYLIEHGLLFLSKTKEPIYSGFRIIQCSRGRRLKIEILAGGKVIGLHKSVSSVEQIKIES